MLAIITDDNFSVNVITIVTIGALKDWVSRTVNKMNEVVLWVMVRMVARLLTTIALVRTGASVWIQTRSWRCGPR